MNVLYAATGNHVARTSRSEEGQWTSTVVLADHGVQCIAVDPINPERLYAGTFDDGLYRSRDAGHSWDRVDHDIPHNRFPSVAISPSRTVNGQHVVYAGTEPSSLYVSEDDGESWSDLPELRSLPRAPTWSFPPRPWTSHVRWIALSWHDPDLIFAGIELGGVMRSIDGGATWEDRKPGSYHDSHCIRTHPTDSTRVYEAAGGGVASSHDAGGTWKPVDDGLDRQYVWALAVDPSDPARWYVSATHGPGYAHRDADSSEAIIFRKTGSDPWHPLSNGLDHPMAEMPFALVIPEDKPSTIYAGTRQGSLLISDDAGDSWRKTEIELDGIEGMVVAPPGDQSSLTRSNSGGVG